MSRRACTQGVLSLLLVSAASATVIVPMSDATLVARADVVATGVVERVEPVVTAEGAIETWATLRVIDTLKGRGQRGRLVVRQPGGRVGTRGVAVFGTTPLTAGEALLVFARRGRQGGHRPVGMALGIYRLSLDATGTAVATRPGPSPDARPLAEFATQISRRAGVAPLRVDVSEATTARFTFLGSPPGRWFEFDRGDEVRVATANGDRDLGRQRSDGLVSQAFAAWTNVPVASAKLVRGSDTPTAPSVAGGFCDGKSVVQFNDPLDELDDLVACTGVLAVGGFCSSRRDVGPGGATYNVISEGDITVNRRIADCFTATDVAEVVTHEAGHLLGLGHSSENPGESDPTLRDATMFFLAHFDGRGAALRDDDRAGLAALYPTDTDEDGVPDEFDRCPGTTRGEPADATGCACSDPGHLPCPPSDDCTDSRCDGATATCIATPVDCTDGDPCLTGFCTLESGCSSSPLGGFVAVSCAFERDFAPPVCAGQRIPPAFRRLVRRAGRKVTRASGAVRPQRSLRLLDRAERMLEKSLRKLERATDPTRRRPLVVGCADALALLAEDARRRVEDGRALFVP